MRHALLTLLAFLIFGAPRSASAHDVRSTLIFLDLGSESIDVEVQIPVQELQTAFGIAPTWRGPIAELAPREQLERYVRTHLRITTSHDAPYALTIHDVGMQHVGDGESIVAHTTFTAPAGANARRFTLHSDLVVHQVQNHNTLVLLRHDALSGMVEREPELLGMLHYQQLALPIERTDQSLTKAFSATFQLGMRHIAEGTDHLLFLLVLLLPACLLADERHWAGPAPLRASLLHIAKVVSAFTLGHSLTLLLGTLGITPLATSQVEVLIAASIVLSALHAARPLFAKREHLVSGAFGLIHGMAFATVLQGLAVDRTTTAISLLGFNLGIEAMQLAVVALTMPSLLVLSRRPSLYGYLRTAGAILAALLGGAWLAERAWDRPSQLTTLAEALTTHGSWLIGLLATCAALSCLLRTRAPTEHAPTI